VPTLRGDDQAALPARCGYVYTVPLGFADKSATGLAQSKTLRVRSHAARRKVAPASWTAVVLHRFLSTIRRGLVLTIVAALVDIRDALAYAASNSDDKGLQLARVK